MIDIDLASHRPTSSAPAFVPSISLSETLAFAGTSWQRGSTPPYAAAIHSTPPKSPPADKAEFGLTTPPMEHPVPKARQVTTEPMVQTVPKAYKVTPARKVSLVPMVRMEPLAQQAPQAHKVQQAHKVKY